MIGIYLLITILTQLSPAQYPLAQYPLTHWSPRVAFSNISGVVDIARITPDTEQSLQLRTEFSALNGLRLGSPVLFEGRNIGSVAQIEAGCSSLSESSSCFEVALGLKGPTGLLNQDQIIALITSRINVERSVPFALVELLPLDDKTAIKSHRLDQVPGYSSISEFWTAPLSNK